jgi:transposase-like protein
VPAKARRRRFTAAYKLRILEEADQRVKHGQLGALLRREGLYSSHIQKWRAQRDAGALAGLSRKRGRKPTRRHDAVAVENEQLRREAARLQQRLEQAELIIDIQKKVAAVLGIPMSRPENGEDA